MLNQHTSTGKYLHHHSDPLGNKFHAPCPTLEHEQAGQEKRSRSKADDTLAGNNSLIGGDEAQFGRTRTKAASFPSHPPRSESRGLDDDLVLVTLTLVQERAKYMSIVTGEPDPSASKPPLVGARSDEEGEEGSSALFWTWNTLPVQAWGGSPFCKTTYTGDASQDPVPNFHVNLAVRPPFSLWAFRKLEQP